MKVLRNLVISALFILALSATTYGQAYQAISMGQPDGHFLYFYVGNSSASYSWQLRMATLGGSNSYAHASVWVMEYSYAHSLTGGGYQFVDGISGGGSAYTYDYASFGVYADASNEAYAEANLWINW